MVKNSSYHQLASIPATTPTPPYTGSIPTTVAPPPTNPNPNPKRRPGRPPKPKEAQPISPAPPHKRRPGRPPKQHHQFHQPHLVEDHQIMMAPAEVPFQTQTQAQAQAQAQPIPSNGLLVQKRRPGRPPKQPKPQMVAPPFNGAAEGMVVAKRRPGRPAKYNVGGVVRSVGSGTTGRPRGRPPKKFGGLGPVSRPVGKRPRGRPPKLGGFSGGGVVMVSGKRPRGRPPKGSVSTPPKMWKPLGRPRKDGLKQHTSEQGRENEELTRKLDLIQSRIRDAIGIIKPYVAHENAALMELQQLEELVTPNVTAQPTEPPTEPPPIMAAPMNVMVPPPSAASPYVGFGAGPNLTAPPPGTVTAPVVNAPAPFSVTLPPMTMTAPFPGPPGIDSQPSFSWMSGEGQL